MNVAVTGASGLIGSTLVPFLTASGNQVTRFVRSSVRSAADEALWDPERGLVDSKRLEEYDAVIHLAGANIAEGRWTPERKRLIRESRVQGTRTLCEALVQLSHPPKTLLCASATGYYGDRGAELVDEDSAVGKGFLAEVCQAWEEATRPAQEKGIRVVLARLGVVLAPAGGALAKMLLPFQLGLGGVIGDGSQYMSWIALDDVIGVFHHALVSAELHGPVNVVAPSPVTNREFTKTLGHLLRRPTLLPLPAFAARLVLGEMAEALLLASTRAAPKRLLATGYRFRYPTLEGALRRMLGKA